MRRKTRAIARTVTGAAAMLGFGLFGALSYASGLADQPAPVNPVVPVTVTGCPQEDSCDIDYHGGAWTITPQVP